jgi:hypothetical protein
MNRYRPAETIYTDDGTLQAWENMRIEILHELQEGASADVPDALLDDFGNLIVVLASWRAQRSPITMPALKDLTIGARGAN